MYETLVPVAPYHLILCILEINLKEREIERERERERDRETERDREGGTCARKNFRSNKIIKKSYVVSTRYYLVCMT